VSYRSVSSQLLAIANSPQNMSKSSSGAKMSTRDALKALGLSKEANVDEVNAAFQKKLSDLQKKYSDKPDKLVAEADTLYLAYRTAYRSRDGASEDQILPLTITGPDAMLNMFGIDEVPHQSLKVQMQSQAQYRDGQLVRKESSKTESFINKDGRRETKVYENGKLIKHTIDDKNMLK